MTSNRVNYAQNIQHYPKFRKIQKKFNIIFISDSVVIKSENQKIIKTFFYAKEEAELTCLIIIQNATKKSTSNSGR